MNRVPEDSLPLPKLREDLQILEGPVSSDGSPSWKIYDPVCNKFFLIGWSVFQLVSRWDIGNSTELINRVSNETSYQVDKDDVEKLITFLHAHNLTRDSASGSSNDFVEQYKATKSKWYVWLVKNYLFIRIPIFRPRRFLKKTMHLVEPLYSRPFVVSMIVLAFVSLYLVARQ